MSKLLIVSDTIGPKGKVLERGQVVEIDDPKHVYDLIAAGRAIDHDTTEAKEEVKVIAEEKAEAAEAAKAKAKSKAAP